MSILSSGFGGSEKNYNFAGLNFKTHKADLGGVVG